MFPAPFPAHNMMLTCCWVMDEFTKENVSVFECGSGLLMSNPTVFLNGACWTLLKCDCGMALNRAAPAYSQVQCSRCVILLQRNPPILDSKRLHSSVLLVRS